MRYTTPPPCRDLAALVPEIRPFARTTVRLHPHRAVNPLPVHLSKIGGLFLHPQNEPWPRCPMCEVDMVPVLQIRRRDVPEVVFRAGADTMQLFWCPDDTAHDYQPFPVLRWRDSVTVTEPRQDGPDLGSFARRNDWDGIIPFECAIYPERVT